MTGSDWQQLGSGLVVTLALAMICSASSLVLGTVIGVLRIAPVTVVRALAAGYSELFVNVPLLLVLLFVFFGLPQTGLRLSPWGSAMAALTIYHAAYVAEVVRAGLQSVPAGHLEAARALGLSFLQTLRFVLLPQALGHAVPPLGNVAIALVKNTSLAGAISVFELLKQADTIESRTFSATPFFVAGLLYLVLTIPLAWLVNRLEQHARQQQRLGLAARGAWA
jgi:His/Glu/Gln/Arg/opine family amino acid ABC transporter permease subunit